MIGRTATTAAAALVAMLAWGSGLDRMSASAPALARLVPAPLKSWAWRSESAGALLARRSAAARGAAERAVAADPLDAGAASRLGAARFVAGDGPGAAAAYRVAGALGWRDAPTQLYWLAAALQAGEVELAADRLDALLRQDPQFDRRNALIAPFEATAAGREALAKRLAALPSWRRGYFEGGIEPTPAQLDQRARVAELLARHGTAANCAELASLAGALVAADRALTARDLWRQRCGGATGLLADGGFERARLVSPSPFDWQFVGAAGLDIAIAPVEGFAGRAALVASTLPGTQAFASQGLTLSEGRYRLSWRARAQDGAPSPRIRVRLACSGRGGEWRTGIPASGGSDVYTLDLVATVCPLHDLAVGIEPGEGAVALDDLKLVRAASDAA